MAECQAWRPGLALRLSAGLHAAALGALVCRPGWWPWLLGGVAANHAAFALAAFCPNSQMLGRSTHRLPGSCRKVALTFDDGPDPDVTPRVLDLLGDAGVTASFFCIAERARAHPALLRRIVAEGHRVENHTFTHPLHFAFLAGWALRREVADAQAALADLAGAMPVWFRAPMGICSPLLHPVLGQVSLDLASWSGRGYDTRCGDPAVVEARLMRAATPGAVLLLHDGNAARAPGGGAVSLAVLPRLLDALRARGLDVTALPDATAASAVEPGIPA